MTLLAFAAERRAVGWPPLSVDVSCPPANGSKPAAAPAQDGTDRRTGTSRQCCASCTGFQSRVELTSNWHVLSSRLCLVTHLRTCLTTYIWSRKGLDVTCARLPTDRVLFHAYTTHSVTEVSLSRGLVSGIALVFLQPGRNVTSCLIARYKYSY